MKDKKIIILQGGSGSGKSTLAEHLKTLGIPRVITCTTREPRAGELDCRDYYFFKDKKAFLANDLLEYAEYSGELYGTLKSEVDRLLATNKAICLILEQKGAKKLREIYPNNVIVISFPISCEDLQHNLIKRGDTSDFIKTRVNTAKFLKEDKALSFADYVIIGNNIESKKKDLEQILQNLNLI